jgi:hypothetical protein
VCLLIMQMLSVMLDLRVIKHHLSKNADLIDMLSLMHMVNFASGYVISSR